LLTPNPDLYIPAVHAGGWGEQDPAEVLASAAQEGRILVTHDVSTMLAFAYERVTAEAPDARCLRDPLHRPAVDHH
jgi:hypothetical protein